MFYVLPENWVAIEILQSIHTQWEYDPAGNWRGYNYPGVDIVLKRLFTDIENGFEIVQICEQAILDAIK